MNVVEWQAAVHEGAALVVDAMDRQTEVLGELASEVYGLAGSGAPVVQQCQLLARRSVRRHGAGVRMGRGRRGGGG